MKKAILIPNPIKDSGLGVTTAIVEKLIKSNILPCISEKSGISLTGLSYYSVPPADADVIIVVGGDGSVIDASELAIELNIPLLGVNLGRLATGEYRVEEKMLLCAEKLSQGMCEKCSHLAVNDVIVSHEGYLGISDIMIDNGRGDCVSYRADGIISSTPAGSTAYSLSAGGPIISHTLDSITVTPICTHSFLNRSIVYAPDERVRISNVGDSILNVSVDGRHFTKIAYGEAIKIYKSDKKFKTLAFSDSNVFAILSKKINTPLQCFSAYNHFWGFIYNYAF